VTLLLNRELVSRVKLCLVSVSPDIVKDCPKIRNLPKIFLRSFENVAPGLFYISHSPHWMHKVGGIYNQHVSSCNKQTCQSTHQQCRLDCAVFYVPSNTV